MTKHLNYIIGVSLISLCAACSGTDEIMNENQNIDPSNPFPEGSENSDVQITLSASNGGTSVSSSTRAIIEPDDDGNFSLGSTADFRTGDYLGIFCLAKDKQDGTNSAAPNWTLNPHAPMQNVVARAVKVPAKNGVSAYTDVQWDSIYYYPAGNYHKFGFYGYYPHQEDSKVDITEQKASVTIPINGKTDILYGQSTETDDMEFAYSAKYFHKLDHKETVSDRPNLQFKHKLVHLKFFAIGKKGWGMDKVTAAGQAASYSEKFYPVSSLYMEYVKVKTAKDGKLCIADLATANNEAGKFTPTWTNADYASIYKTVNGTDIDAESIQFLEYKSDAEAAKATDAEKTAAGGKIGKGDGKETLLGEILVPLPDASGSNAPTYLLSYKVKYVRPTLTPNVPYPDDLDPFPEATLNFSLPLPEKTNFKWEEGHQYNVYITVNGPHEIAVTATLDSWVPNSGDSYIEY